MRCNFRAAIALLGMLGAGAAANAQMVPGGFYLRGDVGGAFAQNITFTDADPSAANCDLCGAKFLATMNDSVIFGGGIGYRFSPAWRIDLTADYLPWLRGSGASTQTPPDMGSAAFSSLAIMTNGYFDFAGLAPSMFGPFQPYITAGVGFARDDLGTFTGTKVGFAVSETGSTTTNLAWAAGAGVGYPITANMTLDLAYKYFDVGGFRTGTIVSVSGVPLPPLTASKSSDLGVQTIIASLRFSF